MIDKYFVVFKAYIRIWDYPQFQKLQKHKQTAKRVNYRSNF